MSTSYSLSSHHHLIRDKFFVKDRMDLPFVKSLRFFENSKIWPHKSDDKFKPDRAIHDIRDEYLYPMTCIDTDRELTILSDQEVLDLWGDQPFENPKYSDFWDYSEFIRFAPQLGLRNHRFNLFNAIVAKWTKQIKENLKSNPNSTGFNAIDTEKRTFHFMMEIANREKYSQTRCP